MSYLLKDPDAVLDYAIDWGAEYLQAEELLATSGWTALPDEPGGIAVVGSAFDTHTATVKAAGGIAGHVYRLVNGISTSGRRSDERSVVVRVEER